MTTEEGAAVRLSKLIARRGLASRREAEQMVMAGRVTVNGQVVREIVPVVPDRDEVRVDGKPLPPEPRKVYLLMFKPRGYLTTRDDPEGRPTVYDLLDGLGERVEAVGRLDFDTEGALLFTNDGDTAHALAHPRTQVPKRYRAKVYRTPPPDKLEDIRQGRVFLEDGRIQPARCRVVDATDRENAWVEITVTEGRNRLVRRLFQQLRHPVSKLRRESFATLSIRGMERGQVRPLSGEEVKRILDIAQGVRPQRAGKKRKKGHAVAKLKVRPQAKKRRLAKLRQRGRISGGGPPKRTDD